MNALKRLNDFGQSLWYDNIHRRMLENGDLAKMIAEDGLVGITSNPAIFEKAIAGSSDYDHKIKEFLEEGGGFSNRDLFFKLAIEDIRQAADCLKETYERTQRQDGYVSLEVSPDLAYDAEATVQEAMSLWKRVDRPNLMIKVPATKACLPAVEQLIANGVNVNVTLLFSVERYQEVVNAYLSGLRQRHRQGLPVDHVASVASFFVSRVDTSVDKILEDKGITDAALLGQAAIANAKLAYKHYLQIFDGIEFSELKGAGAVVQRLLWASTGVKNPAYRDVLYIESLIGPNTVTTVPPATYDAFRDHGEVDETLTAMEGVELLLEAVQNQGVDLDVVTTELEKQGVDLFAKAFENLLAAIQQKADILSGVSA